MLKAELWDKSVPRVELDQRAHDARLRLERIGRQLVPRAASTRSPRRRLLYLFIRRHFRQRVARKPNPRAVEQSAAPPSPKSEGLARSVRFVLSHISPFVLLPLRRINPTARR